jgi:2-octaprenyl-6-methoxyphenol hydroxylase
MSAQMSDVVIIGAGPVGLAAALSLAAVGVDVVIAAPEHDPIADARSTALLLASVALFDNLGAWRLCARESAPLLGIRIIDDRDHLLRAPEVLFKASELALPCFGANIANSVLIAALSAAVRDQPRILWHRTAAVREVTPCDDRVRLVLAEGKTLLSRLVVGADGARSLARQAAAIGVRTWDYPQVAIAGTVRHSRAQNGITSELHRRTGPLTLVPLTREEASFVWVVEPDEARRLADLDAAGFLAELSSALKGLLGALLAVGARSAFPLGGLSAECMGRRRIALVGEAAHVIPPIGAQGLNLGLRDAAALADCVAHAQALQQDIGGAPMLDAYDRMRSGDVANRRFLVDLFNRSLLSDLLPIAAARSICLQLLANLPAARRLAMNAGLWAVGPLPRLMQPSA